MRLAAVALLLPLTGCAGLSARYSPPFTPVPVAAPQQVCPGAALPGSYVCAPPLVCRDGPQWAALDQKWYVQLFTTEDQREGAADILTGIEKILCAGSAPAAATPRG